MMFIIPHECIRQELVRLVAVTDRMPDSGPAFDKLGEYFSKYVGSYLKFHHKAEDEVIFKGFIEKGITMPPTLAEAHTNLDERLIDAVSSAIASKSLVAVKEAVYDLSTFCKSHMAEEERELIPMLHEKGDISWLPEIMGKFGPWAKDAAGADFPLMVKMTYDACKVWGGEKSYAGNLPPSVQENLDGAWETAFAAPKAAAYAAILA